MIWYERWNVYLYKICQDANALLLRMPIRLICRRRRYIRCGSAQKNGPGNRGHRSDRSKARHGRPIEPARGNRCILRLRDRNGAGRHCGPRCGCWRSAGGRSTPSGGRTACWRAARPIDAVLDMFVPFSWCGTVPLRDLGTIYVYQIPETTACLHSSNCLFALQHKSRKLAFQITKGRRKPAALVF